jgi:Cu+-exporting ATPase
MVGNSHQEEKEMTTHTDPVYGMQVDENRAAGKSEHEGKTYIFCSASCQAKFEENPERYTTQGGKSSTS